MSGKNAVVLLSGGLDSTTVLAIAKSEGFVPYALSFAYGQRHVAELDAARRIAEDAGVAGPRRRRDRPARVRRLGADGRHRGAEGPLRAARWAPASRSPTCRRATRSSCRSRWPGPRRWAPATSSSGVNALDYSGYPDCRPEYIEAFERMANLATKAGVEGTQNLTIHTPLIQLTKAGIIRRGLELGVDYAATTQLLRPGRGRASPAARCDACQLRLRGLRGRRHPGPGAVSGQRGGAAMTYAVKEIFYTLQGEGANAGRPAVFCRFAGCNLWTGQREGSRHGRLHVLRHRFRRHRRRRRRQVPHRGRPRRGRRRKWPRSNGRSKPLVVCTGGEPLLQLDEALVAALHAARFRDRRRDQRHARAARRASTGSASAPRPDRPPCCCAATSSSWSIPQPEAQPERFAGARLRALLPAAHGRPRRSRPTSPPAVEYCLAHPQWRLSLQTHKLLGIR